jgi:hypothetical protein
LVTMDTVLKRVSLLAYLASWLGTLQSTAPIFKTSLLQLHRV